ncbi:MAG TPA: winged helix-turn-helix transcriptional regulator [Solirubrobacterales bacterium]|nr:winged helix-turn-helix transcriptional regulator [Solirubrobacterales bacterium]
MLRLLGAGASGPILMALGAEPLRTMELTERVAGYSPRTVYRYATRLTQLGVIARDEEEGVPSKVVHSLTTPRGRELYELVAAYAGVAMKRLRSGEIGGAEWGALALVAELWESGMIDALNLEPKSLTELAHGEHGLSFHQVSRRASIFARSGFVREIPGTGRYRRFALTDKTRLAMGLVAGIGRWRRRHVVPKGSTGLSAREAAGLMRTALPLIVLPGHTGKSFELRVAPAEESEKSVEPVWANVADDGSIVNSPAAPEAVDGAAQGNVVAWVDSVLDGPRNGLRVKGDAELISDCLRALHASLWRNGNGSAAATAEAVAGGRDGA